MVCDFLMDSGLSGLVLLDAGDNRDVLQTEIRKLQRKRAAGERCETKWCIFAKIHPNVRLEGPGTEQNFRFGSGWPV